MQDQRAHWNNIHKREGQHSIKGPSRFVENVISMIPSSSHILELGCGAGKDSVEFAKHGHSIMATDFSKEVIDKNIKLYESIPNIVFKVLNTTNLSELQNAEFDAVYAHLSLHYFTDKVTREIVDELYRIIKPNGYLCFVCKSTDDPLYGKGVKIEDDIYELNGHVRHFFSEEYAKSLLDGHFQIKLLESGNERFYETISSYVKVIAQST